MLLFNYYLRAPSYLVIINSVMLHSVFITAVCHLFSLTHHKMTFLMSMIIILYLNSDLCSGRNKNLMVGMRRHKNVTEKAGDRGDQDYLEGVTMSGEDDRNAGRNNTTMNVQQYRCSNYHRN